MTIDLKVTLLNAENLFILLDTPPSRPLGELTEAEWQSHSTSIFSNKPLGKLLRLRHDLLLMDADLILLTEVGGEESLRNFNELFLEGQYRVALIEGNSDRSIDVGFLVHKRLPSHFNIVTNKDRPINFWYPHERNTPGLPSHKFSRDVAELHLFDRDINNPYFIFLLTHLKSPLDPEGVDPLGSARREAELKTLLEIYHGISQQFPRTPISVCGDLNGNASRVNTDREFQLLYTNTDLEDVLEIAQTPQLERATFYALKGGALQSGRQIDYALLSQKALPYLDVKNTQVFRYEIANRGRVLGPQTSEEKLNLPSDHYPLQFTLRGLPLQLK